jgi:hypothetical protein
MCKRGEESRIYEIFASSTVKDGIFQLRKPQMQALHNRLCIIDPAISFCIRIPDLPSPSVRNITVKLYFYIIIRKSGAHIADDRGVLCLRILHFKSEHHIKFHLPF